MELIVIVVTLGKVSKFDKLVHRIMIRCLFIPCGIFKCLLAEFQFETVGISGKVQIQYKLAVRHLLLCKAHFINADLKKVTGVFTLVNVDYFLIWNGHKASFVPNSHSKTKVQQLLLLNPLYELQAWGEIILRMRIHLRICRPSLAVALQSSFRWRRHDNYIYLIC